MKIIIVISVFNPCFKLKTIIQELIAEGFYHIIIVNDGSQASTIHIINDLKEKHPEIHFLEHPTRRGKGAALKTAFQYIINLNDPPDGIVTADADGQHLVKDIKKVALSFLEDQNKVVLGVRLFQQEIPLLNKVGNQLTQKIVNYFYKAKIIDTQTGLRALPYQLLKKLINLNGQHYEFEMHMLIFLIKNQIPIQQIPINTIYFRGYHHSFFHPIYDSLKIYWVLFKKFWK